MATAYELYPAEYRAWSNAVQRCTNPNNPGYSEYGGRGIVVSEGWRTFHNFLMDMGLKPDPDAQIDRKNNDGNYCKENCRWVTKSRNSRNRNYNLKYTAFGESKCLTDWLEDDRCIVSNYNALRSRLRNGWDVERALTTPTKQYNRKVA